MKFQRNAAIAAALVLGVAFTAQAQEVEAQHDYAGEACTILVNPETIIPGGEPAAIEVKLSSEIGEVAGASAAEESGLSVESFEQKDGKTIQLSLNTAEAAPGEWEISVEGDHGACRGQVKIGGEEEMGAPEEAPVPEPENMSSESEAPSYEGAAEPADVPVEEGQ